MKKRKILLIVFIILSIGLLMVYSSSHIWAQYKENDSFYYFKRQAIFVIVGLLLLFFFSKIDYHFYQKHSLKIIILATILLVLVLIPGVGIVRGGSRSWFNLGLFALQPSEIYKIALIIYVSDYISHHYHQMKKLRYCLKPLIVMGIGFFLIMLQPDFGSGFVMCCSILLMIIITPFPFRYIIFLGLSGILMIILMIISAPYRMKRIFAFLDPFQDPLGSGFQMIQSLYAIGPGGILGSGFDQSIQKHFYLPEPQTDFIFAIYLEEFGQNSFIVRAHPTWYPNGEEESIIREMIDMLLTTGSVSVKKFREATAIMMSCKRSIKANHYLNEAQARVLLKDLAQCENPFNCPHGRPVLIHFTNSDMERMFKRIQDPH